MKKKKLNNKRKLIQNQIKSNKIHFVTHKNDHRLRNK